MDTRITSIDLGARSYDIYIGKGLLFNLPDYLPETIEGGSFYIIADENTAKFGKSVAETLDEAGADTIHAMAVKPGEQSKSFTSFEKTCDWLLENGIKRDSTIIAVGGGVIGDLAGFAAATTLRGVDFIQIPTSLLAQVDSSVGGKTGINAKHGKNLIGAFYQPKAVIADLDTLETLPRRELLAGYAEIVKYGLIDDAPFFKWLEENGGAVCALQPEALADAIEESVKAKARIVESDETEQGRRALLNLGHTFGHALEAAARYDGRLLHGEAVAIGMIMAFELSVRLGHCDPEDLERVENHFNAIGLPTRAADIQPTIATTADALLEIMGKDKKASRKGLTFILVSGIGEAFPSSDVDHDVVHDVIKDSLLTETAGIKERWKSTSL